MEKALARFEGDLSPERILALPEEDLQELIRPAGFFRQKAAYLKNLCIWLKGYDYDLALIRARPLADLRTELLKVRGVGQETADAILLYALDFPSFVVDAYTLRLFSRLPLPAGKTYLEVKNFCELQLSPSLTSYKHLHGLIVQLGKDHCRTKPLCSVCPLEAVCRKQLN